MIINNGPTEFFSGAGTVTVDREVKFIRVLEPATFQTLTMKFPATPASTDADAGTVPTFPPLCEIWDVVAFRLATGAIQVYYKR